MYEPTLAAFDEAVVISTSLTFVLDEEDDDEDEDADEDEEDRLEVNRDSSRGKLEGGGDNDKRESSIEFRTVS